MRGTQSFVYVMSWCWRHPALTALEVAWRWCFGLVVISALFIEGRRIAATATGGTWDPARLGLDHLSLTDPTGTASHLAAAVAVLAPLCWPVLLWFVPLVFALWVVLSALGRTLVLRRADPTLHARPLTLAALQLVRVLAYSAMLLLWLRLLLWAAQVAVYHPIVSGGEPNLLLYFVIVILGTLLTFVLWAVTTWWLAIAPLLAMLNNSGPWQSLRASFRSGPLTMKLIEINLVMGIVKSALVVLAMVFSATPLPFESIATPDFLQRWWLAVTILYLIASDFFHVVRLVACLRLWHATRPVVSASPATVTWPPV